MSTVDIDLFGPPSEEDELHPEFAKVLLGFDPRHVEEFVGQAIERIVALETQLRETRSQLDQARAEIEAANQRSTLAREEAYGEVAGRMAELLRAADHYSEKLRRETEEACKRQLTEAGQEAEQIRREAEASADAHRAEAEAELRAARIEADEILGELAKQRDGLVDILQAMRSNLLQLVDDVDTTTAAAQVPTAFTVDFDEQSILPGVDDLLGSLEGFDIAPPAELGHEEDVGPADETY